MTQRPNEYALVVADLPSQARTVGRCRIACRFIRCKLGALFEGFFGLHIGLEEFNDGHDQSGWLFFYRHHRNNSG